MNIVYLALLLLYKPDSGYKRFKYLLLVLYRWDSLGALSNN